MPGIEKLNYAPDFYNEEVGDEIAKLFNGKSIVPTFFFVDPWGYKGLSLNLVSSLIKDWGCDCIFFFNYNRVNMGINNDAIKQHMASLFGDAQLGENYGILFSETAENTLASFLLWLNRNPKSEMEIGQNIVKLYINDDVYNNSLKTFHDLNELKLASDCAI